MFSFFVSTSWCLVLKQLVASARVLSTGLFSSPADDTRRLKVKRVEYPLLSELKCRDCRFSNLVFFQTSFMCFVTEKPQSFCSISVFCLSVEMIDFFLCKLQKRDIKTKIIKKSSSLLHLEKINMYFPDSVLRCTKQSSLPSSSS